jgi:hypothetical protein
MDLGLLSLAVMHFHFVQRPCAFLGVQQLRRSRAMFSQDRLLVSALLLAFFFAWEPLPNPVWTIGAPLQLMLLQAGCYAGWLLLLLSAALAEVPPFLRLALRTGVLRCSGFATRVARAGIVGGLLLVEWCTAQMNLGHLLFAGALTAYLGVAFLLYRRSVNTAFLRASAVNRPVRPARG